MVVLWKLQPLLLSSVFEDGSCSQYFIAGSSLNRIFIINYKNTVINKRVADLTINFESVDRFGPRDYTLS